MINALEGNNTVEGLIAQSELTAIKVAGIQLEMKVEDDRMKKGYTEAESTVEKNLGPKAKDLNEVKTVRKEVIQKDNGRRWA